MWSSTSTLLAYRRSLILCTVTTSVIKLGLQTPSLNVCNYCLSCRVVDIGIYVTLLSWQCEITFVVVIGIAIARIFLKLVDFNSASLRIGHLSVTFCHAQDKCFSLGMFPFLISRFINSRNHIHNHKLWSLYVRMCRPTQYLQLVELNGTRRMTGS